MQARRREVHNPKDVGKLDCMNLAEPQVLTAEEEIDFRCYDQKGGAWLMFLWLQAGIVCVCWQEDVQLLGLLVLVRVEVLLSCVVT